MNDSKLIRLLSTLSKDEWKEFEKFAASPYFNNGRNYIPMIRELKKFFPGFESAKLKPDLLYSKLYPGKAYNKNVVNTMLSGLYKLCEQFIVQEDIRKNWNTKPLLLKELSIKNMNKEVAGMVKEIEKIYEENKIGAYDYYDKQFMYEEILNHFIRNDDRTKENEYLIKTFFTTVYHLLNQSFIIRNYLFINRNFLNFDYKNNPVEKIMSEINVDKIIELSAETDEQNALQFIVAYCGFMANHSSDSIKYYFKLKELFTKYKNKLDKSMAVRINSMLSNICLRNITIGKSEFHEEFEQIYTFIISNKLYYIDDREQFFDKRLFKAIIVTSLHLKKINWAEEFLKKFIDKTDIQFREHLLQYGLANIEFSKGNFEKALYHAFGIEQKQVIYKIDTKNLVSKIYYETKSYESLLSLLDSYKHLTRNSQLQDEEYFTSHSGFIRIIEKLIKIIQKGITTSELTELRSKAEKMKQLNSKSWLLEKIDELVQK